MLRKKRLQSQTHASRPLGRWCHFCENIVFALGSDDHFLSVSPFSPNFLTMSSSKPIGVDRVNKWTRNSAERLEPERLTEASENAGIEETIRACGQPMQKSMHDRSNTRGPVPR